MCWRSTATAATDDPADADLIVLNTCHIREKAAEKVYSELGRLKQLEEPAAGGAATFVGRRLRRPGRGRRDCWRGRRSSTSSSARRATTGCRSCSPGAGATARAIVATEFPPEPKFDDLAAPVAGAGAVTAFLTVQEGCDKFCTFCVVPYTRGAEYSRPVAEVLARGAASTPRPGVREITLLGQNVNCYHGEGPDGAEWRLGRLIEALAEIDGIARIRYTTSYPADMDDELIAAHRDIAAADAVPAPAGAVGLRPHPQGDEPPAHAPTTTCAWSSGCARRGPTWRCRSDFIVGFPGESDDDFDATCRLVEDVGFAQSFSFKYSPRPGNAGERSSRSSTRTSRASGSPACRSCSSAQQQRVQRRLRRPRAAGAVRAAGAPAGPAGRPQPLPAGGPRRGWTQRPSARCEPCGSPGAGRTASPASLSRSGGGVLKRAAHAGAVAGAEIRSVAPRVSTTTAWRCSCSAPTTPPGAHRARARRPHRHPRQPAHDHRRAGRRGRGGRAGARPPLRAGWSAASTSPTRTSTRRCG